MLRLMLSFIIHPWPSRQTLEESFVWHEPPRSQLQKTVKSFGTKRNTSKMVQLKTSEKQESRKPVHRWKTLHPEKRSALQSQTFQQGSELHTRSDGSAD